jgi:predicted transcriptional regulator
MCGALITENGADPIPDYTAACVIKRLAIIAEKTPSLAILMIHHIAGKTERDIAVRLGISHQAVHERIERAKKNILAISRL